MNAQRLSLVMGVLTATAFFSSLGLIGYVSDTGSGWSDMSLFETFSSESEIEHMLKEAYGFEYGNSTRYDISYGSGSDIAPVSSDEMEHSETNVQVQGVDEYDIVKTDGSYIHVASGDTITIVGAYPPASLGVVSVIDRSYFTEKDRWNASCYIEGIFIAPGRLIAVTVISEQSYWYPLTKDALTNHTETTPDETPAGPRTMVTVFDITDIEHPAIDFSYGVSGYGQSARMIGETVYLVCVQYTWWSQYNELALPQLYEGEQRSDFALDKIHYDPETLDAMSFINILAVDTGSGGMNYESIMGAYSSTIYVSTRALYITYLKWEGSWAWDETTGTYSEEPSVRTTIYKIVVDGLSMKAAARGDVSGSLHNQFSMDEEDSYLRMTTTEGFWMSSSNNVYVLDEDLQVIGSLSGLAPSESIYSTRFVGDTLYLVTFRQIDPLFVVDLSDPRNPVLAGELEMPGFSSYLHPVDSTHILGIGSESNRLKVSVYDVSDPANPVEESKYVDTAYYSWSNAGWDHRAVLFDRELELLVLPVSGYLTNESGFYQWFSGAYVFEVSVDDGISLRGIVEQGDSTDMWTSYVQRSLFIGDYLYTVSSDTIQVNALSDLSLVSSLVYQQPIYDSRTICY